MRKSIILFGVAAGLCACGQTGESNTANVANAAAAESKPAPAYCFFKDSETKGWKASTDKSGNVVVKGKVYREDSRYKAVLGPATVSGATAQIAPTITTNDTGYGAEDDWWDVSATIANSNAVSKVTVTCGAKTLATLQVARKG